MEEIYLRTIVFNYIKIVSKFLSDCFDCSLQIESFAQVVEWKKT